jgi:hypothetical protein
MSKGSTARPTDPKKYSENYDRIFGKKDKKKPKQEPKK